MFRERRIDIERILTILAFSYVLSVNGPVAAQNSTTHPSPTSAESTTRPASNMLPELQPLNITRPILPEDVAKQVKELEAQIAELQERGLSAETRETQDASLDEAIALARKVLAIRGEIQGNGPNKILWRDINGEPYDWYEVRNAQWQLAELTKLKALESSFRREVLRAMVMSSDAETLYIAGDYLQAEPLYLQSLESWRKALGDEHLNVAGILNNLAMLLKIRGDYSKSILLYRDAIAIHRKLLGNEHPALAMCLGNVGALLRARGDYTAAEPLYRESLEMQRRLLGVDHSNVGTALNNLAMLLEDRGDYIGAEQLYCEALAILRRRLGDDNLSVASLLGNLAALKRAAGDYCVAEPLCREALAMRRGLLSGDHASLATGLNSLAILLEDKGDYLGAESRYRDALAMWRRLFGDVHPNVATGLDNLAGLLRKMGEYDSAELLYREALAMRRDLLNDVHPSVATSLGNLAELLRDRGDYVAAEPLCREALAMRRELMGDEHPTVAIGQSNLAVLLFYMGNYADAELLFREAMGTQRKFLGDGHPAVATTLRNLAAVLRERGDYASAEPLYRQALATVEHIRTQIVGGARERAEFAGALRLTDVAAANVSVLTELKRDSEALAVGERGRGRAALDLASRNDDPVTTLRASGDSAAIARYETAVTNEKQGLMSLREAEARVAALRKEKEAIGKSLVIAEADKPMAFAEKDRQVEEGLELIKTRRRELADATAAVFVELRGLIPAANPLTAEQILAALAPGEAILSYVFTDDRAIALVAMGGNVHGFTIAKGKDQVKALREAAEALRVAIAKRPDVATTPIDTAIVKTARESILPPEVHESVAGANALTIIPDGLVNTLPMELLLEGMPIAYAPSATIAIDRRRAAESGSLASARAVLVGDPIFGDEISVPEPQYPKTGVFLAKVVEGSNGAQAGLQRGDVILKYAGHDLESSKDLSPAVQAAADEIKTRSGDAEAAKDERPIHAEVWREGKTIEVALAPGKMGVQTSQISPDEALRTMAFFDRGIDEQKAGASALEQQRLFGGTLNRLPGTAREAEVIEAVMRQAKIDPVMLSRAGATAPALRGAIKPVPRFIHLATHGLPGNADRPYEACIALSKPPEATVDDIGFLTLDELLGQWLSQINGCDLVVLSACDTGKGIAKGDTVMSLPLGFFAAGARTVVASLWKVDDTATSLLMSRFYTNLLGQSGSQRQVDGKVYPAGTSLPKLAALREAKQWLRGLTSAEVDPLRQAGVDAVTSAASRGEGPARTTVAQPAGHEDVHPFAHPYYWAAFVLYGSPV